MKDDAINWSKPPPMEVEETTKVEDPRLEAFMRLAHEISRAVEAGNINVESALRAVGGACAVLEQVLPLGAIICEAKGLILEDEAEYRRARL